MIPGLHPNSDPDLKVHYLTPEYMESLQQKIRSWSEASIREQIGYFRFTLPEHPEVAEVLEGELFARELNHVVRSVRQLSPQRLKELAEKYRKEEEILEIIQTELAIRAGASRLSEKSEGPATVVAR